MQKLVYYMYRKLVYCSTCNQFKVEYLQCISSVNPEASMRTSPIHPHTTHGSETERSRDRYTVADSLPRNSEAITVRTTWRRPHRTMLMTREFRLMWPFWLVSSNR